MMEDIDLRHLDSTWLDHIQSAAVTTLEKLNNEASRQKISKEQAALATMAGGFLYLYHLAQVNDLIDSDNIPKTMH
tara:strand:- start:2676 stop:2903 length:228 start_codon:yes stop_codon:yes gene_type:complete